MAQPSFFFPRQALRLDRALELGGENQFHLFEQLLLVGLDLKDVMASMSDQCGAQRLAGEHRVPGQDLEKRAGLEQLLQGLLEGRNLVLLLPDGRLPDHLAHLMREDIEHMDARGAAGLAVHGGRRALAALARAVGQTAQPVRQGPAQRADLNAAQHARQGRHRRGAPAREAQFGQQFHVVTRETADLAQILAPADHADHAQPQQRSQRETHAARVSGVGDLTQGVQQRNRGLRPIEELRGGVNGGTGSGRFGPGGGGSP